MESFVFGFIEIIIAGIILFLIVMVVWLHMDRIAF